jgi:aminoglycoside phosphotransferase (APT) family kinase protein
VSIDGAAEVRAEDAFDVEAVRTWLVAQGHPLTGEVVVRQFGGGASNLTYSLRTAHEDLILRRPPTGQKAKGAHDMAREFRIQDGLAAVFPLVPQMVALCEDESVIGSQFYVMQRIDGIIPRRDLPPDVELSEDETKALCTNALDVLIDLHRVDVDATPLAEMNKGAGYVRRQVDGWSTRFRNARTDDAPDFGDVMAWLAEHQPADVGSCLIHNDFRFDNLVLDRDDPTRPIGVLDWEMATVGDPLMDLGGTLAYWVLPDRSDGVASRLAGHRPRSPTGADRVQHSLGMGRDGRSHQQWARHLCE